LGIPFEYALHQNYPNPFNPSTQIDYDLPEPGNVSLVVYDILGREVSRLATGHHEAGYYSAVWNGTNSEGRGVASGVYFARFTAADAAGAVKLSKVSKLLLTK
jgi:flagellar hook assembly protein FlgD